MPTPTLSLKDQQLRDEAVRNTLTSLYDAGIQDKGLHIVTPEDLRAMGVTEAALHAVLRTGLAPSVDSSTGKVWREATPILTEFTAPKKGRSGDYAITLAVTLVP